MVQVLDSIQIADFVKVKGHNENDLQCINHWVDQLTHNPQNADLCPLILKTNMQKNWKSKINQTKLTGSEFRAKKFCPELFLNEQETTKPSLG